jgi:beta-glucanase (GH16 family)
MAPTTVPPTEAAQPVSEPPAGLPTIDTFENTDLGSGRDGSSAIGFVTWSDGSPVALAPVKVNAGDALALPDQSGPNTVLKFDTSIKNGGWGGFTHAFASPAADKWLPQDWSPYAGISFWLYGNKTGGTLFIDILDNRVEGSKTDDAERWTYRIPDDFAGWKEIQVPFEAFVRKEISNSAPNDGFTLSQIHGYAIGAVGTVEMGAHSNYVDQVKLYGTAPARPVQIQFAKTEYLVREGGVTTVNLLLNKPAEAPVSVQFATLEGNASPGLDFTLPENTVHFAPGATSASFKIQTLGDKLAEGLEKTILVLSNPVGAVLSPKSRAVLGIRDVQNLDPSLLTDFNEAPPFQGGPGVSLTPLAVAADSRLAQPGQENVENVLQVTSDGTGSFGQWYGAPQDWSQKDGLTLWVYGQNSGKDITVELLDNRAVTTAQLDPKEWKLAWSDEFNQPAGSLPDPGVWKPEIGDGFLNGLAGWGNGELEYYTGNPENVSTDGQGNLAITARKLEAGSTLRCADGPCQYTSARLITWGRQEAEHGRIEARLKLPQGQGLWPAFWMLGSNLAQAGWPQSGEIDIVENIGREPKTAHGTLHGPGYSGGNGLGSGHDLPVNLADDFHVYAIEWTPERIRWFVDDVNFFSASPADLPSGKPWVYNQPFFVILNVAVGGAWPGNPDDSTRFPQTMLVDYVRMYGAQDTSERFTSRVKDNFSGWKEVKLPFSAFSRSATQPDKAPNDGLNRQIWGYRFSFPAGTYWLDKLRLPGAK